jgi:hypothetical protein
MSGLYGGSKEFSATQQQPSTSPSKSADSNAARISFHADADPIKAGQDNTFHVNLTDAAGKPIADAQVTISLVMPAMPAMNMPEMKSSFNLPWVAARQMYMGKGQPPMEGTLNVLVEARKNNGVIASFHTHLSAR